MADYVNPGVVAGIGFDNFFRQQKADQIEAAKQELESHINALKLKAAQQDVEDQQVAKLQKRAIAEESQLMPGDYVPPDMQERRKAANLPPLREKVLPGLDEAQGPTQQGATLADPSRIYMPVQAELAQQKAAEQQQTADAKAAHDQKIQAARIAAAQAPDRQTAARLLAEAGDDPKYIDEVFKPAEPEGLPALAVDPKDGQLKPVPGVAPQKGQRIITLGKPVTAGGGSGTGKLKPGTIEAAAAAGFTPDGIADAAVQYRLLGKLPGRDAGINVIIQNEAARQKKALGQSPEEGVQKQMAMQADLGSLKKAQSLADMTAGAEYKALQQLNLVSQLSKEVPRTQFPIVNDWYVKGLSNVAGDSPAHRFYNAIETFTEEYGKIMTGSVGSVQAASDSGRAAAKRLIDASLNEKTLQDTLSQMKQEMEFTKAGWDATTKSIQERMLAPGVVGGVSPTPPNPAASVPDPAERQKRIDAVKAKYGLK